MTWKTAAAGSAALAALLGSSALPAQAGERQIKKAEVPGAVLRAVSAKHPKSEMIGFSRETEKGKTVYEVWLKAGAVRIDVSVSPEGKILVEEQTVALQDVPEPVRKALAGSAYAKADVRRIEKVTKGEAAEAYSFEVLLNSAGKQHELVFLPTGKLMKDEAANEQGEEDDDD